ncbi:hypothetical protein [uncultured Tateyamaria sp.]|uniref:hypothetical protein n=1 Tax=uncultured Tateyamaria sp. TaxID=455651 RepID=UPI002601FCDC|nr:hypothetical protein [uncultured Tateyamaria sp.]
MQVTETSVPTGTLIADYAARDGHYSDCFEVALDTPADLARYISAFYTQPLFRAERWVLRLLARAPSTDAEVAALADGTAQSFAVWEVAGRTQTEILLQAKDGRTLSWLQAEADSLRFGSVVVPVQTRGGALTLGPVFQSLVGAHKVYSRALLAGAARRVT